ncbi:MAG TPA: hypothetical protein VKM94_26675 [Blastocatellia bacterium]|nr:hypothetical protein [Blastocatellia bacterium]
MKGDFPTASHNVSYALVNSTLLALTGYNAYSIDRLRLRRWRVRVR